MTFGRWIDLCDHYAIGYPVDSTIAEDLRAYAAIHAPLAPTSVVTKIALRLQDLDDALATDILTIRRNYWRAYPDWEREHPGATLDDYAAWLAEPIP